LKPQWLIKGSGVPRDIPRLLEQVWEKFRRAGKAVPDGGFQNERTGKIKSIRATSKTNSIRAFEGPIRESF
jgi:hypothetical protein